MLKPKALTQVLNQANSGGVRCTLLISPDGTLMAYAGFTDKRQDGESIAAIASGIWSCFEKAGKQSLSSENLNIILMEFEDGNVAISKVCNLLLCIYAKPEVGFGILKAKSEALVSYLTEPMKQVSVN